MTNEDVLWQMQQWGFAPKNGHVFGALDYACLTEPAIADLLATFPPVATSEGLDRYDDDVSCCRHQVLSFINYVAFRYRRDPKRAPGKSPLVLSVHYTKDNPSGWHNIALFIIRGKDGKPVKVFCDILNGRKKIELSEQEEYSCTWWGALL